MQHTPAGRGERRCGLCNLLHHESSFISLFAFRGVVVSSLCAFARTFMKTQGDAEAERQVDATLLAVNDAFGCGCVIAHLASGGVHPFARVRTCNRSFACGVKADARLSARV